MPEIVSTQGTEEWFTARRGRVTASVAAAALGVDPHNSRQKAARLILDTEPARTNSFITWGQSHEAEARRAYEALTGRFVDETGFWVHPQIEWLGASPDGLVGNAGLVEIKCPQKAPQSVPIHHRIQCLIQLAVTGRIWCDYFAYAADGSQCLHTVRPAGIAGLLRRLEEFYRRYILTNIVPERAKPRRNKAKS